MINLKLNLQSKHLKLFCLFTILVSIFYRFIGNNEYSLWYDEMHSVLIANPANDFSEWIRYYYTENGTDIYETHPPLFNFILTVAFNFFGYTEVTARLLTAILGVLGIVSIYYLGKELLNKELGWISAAILSNCYIHLYYSYDARPYTLLFIFVCLSFIYFIRTVRGSRNINFGIWASINGLLVMTHYFGFLIIVSQGFLIALLFLLKKFKFLHLLKYGISSIITIVVFIPWIPIFRNHLSIEKFWIKEPENDIFFTAVSQFFANNWFIDIIFWILFLLLSVRVVKNYTDKKELFIIYILCVATIFLVFIIPFIKSFYGTPMLIPRYLFSFLPLYIILFGLGIMELKNDNLKHLLILSVLSVNMINSHFFQNYREREERDDFRSCAKFVLENNPHDYPITTGVNIFNNFYFKGYGINKDLSSIDYSYLQKMSDSSKIDNKTRGIWLVYAPIWRQPIPENVYNDALNQFNIIHNQKFPNSKVVLFETKLN